MSLSVPLLDGPNDDVQTHAMVYVVLAYGCTWAVVDLEGALRVPWNPPFKTSLYGKIYFIWCNQTLHARQKSMHV